MYTNIIGMYLLCMVKARIRWYTWVENILTLGKLLSLWFCFLLHSILFLRSQTSYRTYKIISSYELARPVMGTIFLVIIMMTHFFRWVFSVCTEAIATSLIPLDTILPDVCAFIIGISCTVWTKMRSLAGSLADGVLTDAILFAPRSPIPPTNIRIIRGPRKKYGKL